MFTEPSSIQPIQNETLTEGGSVTLFCNASGMPSPSVSWIKLGGGELTNRSELVFTNISRSEAGEYRCEASNLCANATESATVDVLCKSSMNYPCKTGLGPGQPCQLQGSPGWANAKAIKKKKVSNMVL